MTQRIKVSGVQELQRELAKQDRLVYQDLIRTCRRAAEHGRTAAIRHAAAEGIRPHPGGTGKDYASSFGVTPTSDGAVMGNRAPHAYFVERGRRAGRPPPVSVILVWMFERGMIKRIPNFKQTVHVDKSIKGRTRRIMIGVKREVASQRRTTAREAYVAQARSKAYAIARSIGKKGMRGKFPIGKSLVEIKRFIKRELARVARGDHR